MDAPNQSLSRTRRLRQLHVIFIIVRVVIMLYMMWHMMNVTVIRSIQLKEGKRWRKRPRFHILNRESDVFCRNELHMDRNVFNVLCEMLRDIGGLRGTNNMSIEEIVAIFLYTLAHHKKNRSVSHYFIRSGESVSRHFNHCLRAVLKLHGHLLANPTPIGDDCEDDRWKPFKNHKKAKGLYGVPFPYYDILVEIYGKDRATGEPSESFVQATQNINVEMTHESVTLDSDDDLEVQTETESMQSGSGASGSRKRKDFLSQKKQSLKKKKDEVGDLSSSLHLVSTEFGNFFQDMNSHLGEMAQIWRSEEERKKKLDDESNIRNDCLITVLILESVYFVVTALSIVQRK